MEDDNPSLKKNLPPDRPPDPRIGVDLTEGFPNLGFRSSNSPNVTPTPAEGPSQQLVAINPPIEPLNASKLSKKELKRLGKANFKVKALAKFRSMSGADNSDISPFQWKIGGNRRIKHRVKSKAKLVASPDDVFFTPKTEVNSTEDIDMKLKAKRMERKRRKSFVRQNQVSMKSKVLPEEDSELVFENLKGENSGNVQIPEDKGEQAENMKVDGELKASSSAGNNPHNNNSFIFSAGILPNPDLNKKQNDKPSVLKSNPNIPKVWCQGSSSFADVLRARDREKEEEITKMEYFPPDLDSNGELVVKLIGDYIEKANAEYALCLCGYFLGEKMAYSVVNYNLRRMWRAYGLVNVSSNNSGFFFFKYEKEEGMKSVLESGTWLVNNVPLFLKKWNPDIVLEKPAPTKVPVWIKIIDLPTNLWSGGSIGQLASRVGKPILMDKLTKERCIHKSGRSGFARVLVEVCADGDLPDTIKAFYPVAKDVFRSQKMIITTRKNTFSDDIWKGCEDAHGCRALQPDATDRRSR